jgi:threonine synthase
MLYRSTRGGVEGRSFSEVLFDGMAPDGGLYMPETWPSLPDGWDTLDYPDLVAAVLMAYLEPDPLAAELPELCTSAYGSFRHPGVAPLRQVERDRYLLELTWGPTLSFKDYALQVLGRLFDRALIRSGRNILVLGATSGDTGSAAIEACRGAETIEVFILYPHGRVSEIQRRQMTTVPDANVHVVAVEGTFDDCQALVKHAFADVELRSSLGLAAVNSINWARVAVQACYYVWAAARAGQPVSFSVPTGNFGNVFAGYVAAQMGAPVARLIIACNRNHGLSDLVNTGTLVVSPVEETVAPAMDIQLPSNLERYVYELCDRRPEEVRALLDRLRVEGKMVLGPEHQERMAARFSAGWLDDAAAIDVIRRVEADTGMLLDPHTAIGWQVGERLRWSGEPLVTISTAHPAKFGEAVQQAIGRPPPLPGELAGLMERPERIISIPARPEALKDLLTGGGRTGGRT